MFHLLNQTPFHAQLLPTLDLDGGEGVMVLVKGTFTIEGDAPRLAAEQLPPFMQDVYWGDPATSSLRYASDLVPEKKGTDVVLIGSAHPRRPVQPRPTSPCTRATSRRSVRVIGKRTWKRVLGLVSYATKAEPLLPTPLRYEQAFGGSDKTHADEKQWKFEAQPGGDGPDRQFGAARFHRGAAAESRGPGRAVELLSGNSGAGGLRLHRADLGAAQAARGHL